MQKKIFLVTGFLGSGKTTFLQNLLAQIAPLHKIGVIVNEFGRTSIDGSLLAVDGLELHELSGGSIFCACLKTNFITALNTFLQLPIEYLFIESSGLANPAEFRNISRFIDNNTCIESIAIICLVDAKYFLDQLDMFNSVEIQVSLADYILINKIDLIDTQQLANIKTSLHAINPTAAICETSFGDFDFTTLNKLALLPPISRTNSVDFRPFTHTLIATTIISVEQLQNFLRALIPLALRVKGFIHTDSGLMKVDVVGKTINLAAYTECATANLVIIANSQLPINREITAAWQKNCSGSIALI